MNSAPVRQTSVALAFEAGFRARLANKPKDSCPFASAELKEAFNRGWQRCDELEKGKS